MQTAASRRDALQQHLLSFQIFIFLLFNCAVRAEEGQRLSTEHYTAPAIRSPTGSDQQEEIVMAIVVEAGRLECVYQTVAAPKYQTFEIDYQVIEGGDHDITFSIKSPNGVMIANDARKTEGTHRITLDESPNGRGDYALCFDNTYSYTSKKHVFFEIFLLDKDGNYLNDYDLKAIQQRHGLLGDQLDTFNRVTTKLKGNLNEVERMQSQFRAIESRDRSIVETTFERINFWSAVNLLCLVFAGGVQVYMLRSLFLDDSKIGRFIRAGKFS